MSSTRQAIKKQARELLLGRYGFFVSTHLLYFLVSLLVNQALESIFPNWRTSILYLLALFITVLFLSVFRTGLCRLYLSLCRRQSPKRGDMAYAFSHGAEPLLLFYFFLYLSLFALIFLLAFLWSLSVFLPAALLLTGALLGIWLYFFLGVVLVPYLYTDAPWKRTTELIRESRALMQGRKLSYFLLLLSFLGLFLLCLLSFGIGLPWLVPYLETSKALFYLDAAGDLEAQSSDFPSGYSSLETASVVLGVLAPVFLISSFLTLMAGLGIGVIFLHSLSMLYLPLPCGSLAILFALLSRGRYAVGGKGKSGLVCGMLGLCLTLALFIGSFVYTFTNPQLRSMVNNYLEQLEELYDSYEEDFSEEHPEPEEIPEETPRERRKEEVPPFSQGEPEFI